MFNLLVKLVVACVVVNAQQPAARFKVMYEWNYINFTWPSQEDRHTAVITGQYIPENVHISGVKYFEGYMYLTVPRMKEGVPATLTRISADARDDDTSPPLMPYPSWEMNTEGDCNALQNVQNVEIDPNGLLWILDGGRTGTMTKSPSNKCQPRIVIYNVRTNSTVVSYSFPRDMTNNGSFLYDLVVDDVDGGYAYITDNSGVDPAIIVYSRRENRAWIIRDDTMKAAPEAVQFVVSGSTISSPINIASIALGPRIAIHGDYEIVSKDRTVYFCPLSSYHLYAVSSGVLRNERSASTGITAQVKDVGIKASQTDGMVMDENGVLYYGLLADSSIAKWDSKTPFAIGQKVIARDRTYIQWPDSLTFDDSGNLLVVTNRLQKFISGKLNITESNFRILEAYIGTRSYLYSTEPSSIENDTSKNAGASNNTGKFYYDTYSTQTSQNEVTTEAPKSHATVLQIKVIFSAILTMVLTCILK